MTFLTSSLAYILTPFLLIGASIGTALAPRHDSLGASQEIPTTIAFFETTLASAITSSATSFTLTSATDADGTSLASSTYAFVIDEGSSNEEIVLADCTGTTCTNAERGISVRTGNTEVTALKKAHRRGASVKITDAPILVLMARALRGDDVTSFTPSGNGSLVTKSYVDALSFGGIVAATESDDGFIELATQVEMSSSTPLGSSGSSLVLQAKYATSSCQVVGRYVPITDPLTGRIDAGCLDTTYASSSLTIGSTPILDIGKNIYASTSAGTSTWSVPTGITKVKVTAIGGGGGGRSCPGSPSCSNGGGGGGGATVIKIVDVSATSVVQIVVGAGNGAASNDAGAQANPTKFGTYVTATGGFNGICNGGNSGGTASGGDININGGSSSAGYNSSPYSGGGGGNTLFGFGAPQTQSSGTNVSGNSGIGCGGGGAGSVATGNGGSGATGCLIIEY